MKSVGYMVKRPDGLLACSSGVWGTKRSARAAFVRTRPRKEPWAKHYKRGCRVVMVMLQEIHDGR